MDLSGLQTLTLEVIKDHLCVVAAAHPMERIGGEFEELVAAFEARGIYSLLGDADIGAFKANLRRSGQARRFFLRKSGEQQSADRVFTALSRTDTVFACLAADDWELADEVYALSPGTWQREGEYEEDFCYYSYVHACVGAALSRRELATAASWLDRLAEVAAGIPDSDIDAARVAVCSAFLRTDEAAFWRAFERLVDVSGTAADLVPLADGRVFEFPWCAADRYVSVELLGWMALARSRRFSPPQREYRRCPSVARVTEPLAPLADIFIDMERQFGL